MKNKWLIIKLFIHQSNQSKSFRGILIRYNKTLLINIEALSLYVCCLVHHTCRLDCEIRNAITYCPCDDDAHDLIWPKHEAKCAIFACSAFDPSGKFHICLVFNKSIRFNVVHVADLRPESPIWKHWLVHFNFIRGWFIRIDEYYSDRELERDRER